MYSNVDNPFNDVSLSKKFVWKKKADLDRERGISKKERERIERERREETARELEKLNKRREEREMEQLFREQEMARLQREAEQAQLGDWEDREERFHLEQAKKRAEIRIKEGRERPVDILATNLRLANDEDQEFESDDKDVELDLEVEVEEPWKLCQRLGLKDLDELYDDIQMYLSLEKNPVNAEFWRAMLLVCDAQRQKLEEAGQSAGTNSSGAVIDPISIEIEKMLENKGEKQLEALQNDIQAKINSGEPIDTEYWERVTKSIVIKMAEVKLSKMHEQILLARLDKLRRYEMKEKEKRSHLLPGGDGNKELGKGTPEDAKRMLRERQQELQAQHEAKRAAALLAQQSDISTMDEQTKQLYIQEAGRELDIDEAIFAEEEELAKSSSNNATYSWEDKYRPRKPRYHNRVHVGYDWNKYNQTHYDHDNPPPKVVQGYKFNLFYPDLIDKSQAPTYRIEKEPGNEDTVIIRFIAGPPYEDVAFRIVKKEWEHSRKRGFRNSFDKGVLQLHFRFRRQFYRR
ncbi:hypothetical protein H4219_004601 [Mycoemilia scoparia]|uniref:Splicing factor Cactin n=1 Tax=Mycoemilia scoparia TaxID=417184 RepID=A0A9W8DL90_9FUNG|nr:hypothetical protein H4219_004601 [Mycoemilia scoparia]